MSASADATLRQFLEANHAKPDKSVVVKTPVKSTPAKVGGKYRYINLHASEHLIPELIANGYGRAITAATLEGRRARYGKKGTALEKALGAKGKGRTSIAAYSAEERLKAQKEDNVDEDPKEDTGEYGGGLEGDTNAGMIPVAIGTVDDKSVVRIKAEDEPNYMILDQVTGILSNQVGKGFRADRVYALGSPVTTNAQSGEQYNLIVASEVIDDENTPAYVVQGVYLDPLLPRGLAGIVGAISSGLSQVVALGSGAVQAANDALAPVGAIGGAFNAVGGAIGGFGTSSSVGATSYLKEGSDYTTGSGVKLNRKPGPRTRSASKQAFTTRKKGFKARALPPPRPKGATALYAWAKKYDVPMMPPSLMWAHAGMDRIRPGVYEHRPENGGSGGYTFITPSTEQMDTNTMDTDWSRSPRQGIHLTHSDAMYSAEERRQLRGMPQPSTTAQGSAAAPGAPQFLPFVAPGLLAAAGGVATGLKISNSIAPLIGSIGSVITGLFK